MSGLAGPHQITERHLARKAVVYVRQSSMPQVRDNVGSTAVQRSLTDKVQAWGWNPELVEILDEDLGVSGSRPGARDGFNRLIDRMRGGEIGLVAVVDSTRLSRNLNDAFSFIETARRNRVLVALGDQVIDYTDPNSLFVGGIFALNAVRETHTFINLSTQARRRKAEAGIAPTTPPVGYVRRPGGRWEKDPDPRVREIIALVFDTFLKIGTVRGVVRHFRSQQVQVPRRRWRNGAPWQDATYGNISGFLKNPVYSGRYTFGQTVQEAPPEGSKARGKQRPLPPTDWVVIDSHHEPYVDPARWHQIQQQRAANHRTVRPPMGQGEALVQGLLRCAAHGNGFQTLSDGRVQSDGRITRSARYVCRPDWAIAGSHEHKSITARRLDAVVERALLKGPGATPSRSVRCQRISVTVILE